MAARMYFLPLPELGVIIYPLPDLPQHARWADPVDDQGRPCLLIAPRRHPEPVMVEAGHETASLTFSRRAPGPILSYQLSDPDLASVRFPLELTIDGHAELDEDDGYRYTAVRGEGELEHHVVDVSAYRPWPIASAALAEPRPEPPAGATWTAASTWARLFGIPAHDHVLPGYLSGFHAAVRTALAAHPNRATGWLSRDLRVETGMAKRVEFVFAHEDGLTYPVKQGRRKLQRAATETIHVDLQVGPDTVPGHDLAHAISEWDRRLAEVLEQLPEPSVVCSACRGLGFRRSGKA